MRQAPATGVLPPALLQLLFRHAARCVVFETNGQHILLCLHPTAYTPLGVRACLWPCAHSRSWLPVLHAVASATPFAVSFASTASTFAGAASANTRRILASLSTCRWLRQ
eukprot:scaffold118750_cov32-Tisochrysis_lutea.AAC.3